MYLLKVLIILTTNTENFMKVKKKKRSYYTSLVEDPLKLNCFPYLKIVKLCPFSMIYSLKKVRSDF